VGERLQRVEDLYHAALALTHAERVDFLREACLGDHALCRDVEALLAQSSAASDFLNEPAMEAAAHLIEDPHDSLTELGTACVFPCTGRFVMLHQFRAGGMGIVYEALDRERNIRVALKVLPRVDPRALLRFKEEFRALGALVHPNLVSLYELFSDGNVWFFTMELVEGVDFLSYVGAQSPPYRVASVFAPRNTKVSAGEGPTGSGNWRVSVETGSSFKPAVDGTDSSNVEDRTVEPQRHMQRSVDGTLWPPGGEERLRSAFLQLVAGVSALHEAGSMHCDLKPANVLVRNDSRVVVLDYGLVRRIHENSTPADPIAGTAAYMSPEQAAAEPLTPASDWYAVGIMLYEALTGRCPFTGTVEEIIHQKLMASPAPPSAFRDDTPPDLERLCIELLRRDPRARPSATEIVARLRPPNVPATSSADKSIAREVIPFVGRADHLGRLATAFEGMAQNGPVLVEIRGRSGMGKSTLLGRFLEDAAERHGTVVLPGRCFEQESVPYKAIDSLVDALTRYLLGLPNDELVDLLPPNVSSLARVFPVMHRLPGVPLGNLPPNADLTELRRRAFATFRELLTRLGTRNLLIVAIDDLQWGDADSAALLANLLQPPTPPRLLLLLSYRSEYQSTSVCLQTLEESLRQNAHVASTVLNVDPLSPDESRDLAHILLQLRAPYALDQRDQIANEAGGNPYFIYELVTHAQTSSDWFVRGSRAELDDVLWRRVQQLPDEPRRLLEIIAVAGQPLQARTAYEAANLQDIGHSPVMLRAARLIRSSGPGLGDDVEVYHDRIRESITPRLSQDVLKRHHERLARTLETVDHADAETVAIHFDRAGQPERAGSHYARAAQNAADALAFERAALLYRYALDRATVGSEVQHDLQVHVAQALANAGRGYDAARAYTVASEGQNPDHLFEFSRLAATQYCISGHIAEGRRLFRDVLGQVGLRPPAGPVRTSGVLVWRRLRLRLIGLAFVETPASRVSATALRRIDALWSYSAALSTVDVLGVAAVQTQCLLLALRAGEPYRLARSLAWEAVLTSASGWKSAKRARSLLDRADELAQRANEPHAYGMVSLASGWAAFLQMRQPDALGHGRNAERIFRDQCTAAWWELSTTRTMIAWALVHCGNVNELARVTPAYVNDARDRGDLATLTNLGAVATPYLRLAADEPDGARQQIDEAAALWRHKGVHIQHVALLFSRLSLALYVGEGEAAWHCISVAWSSLRRSMQLHNQVARVVMRDLRARSAIAASVARADSLLLTHAESDARRIRRESAPWAAPFADRIIAGVASARRNQDAAVPYLEKATAGFEALQLTLHAAACRRRLGQIVGGDKGQGLIADAERCMRSEHVRDVGRMTDMYVSRCGGLD
jgi:eukaryotic-like serine/threonine-protein kinase